MYTLSTRLHPRYLIIVRLLIGLHCRSTVTVPLLSLPGLSKESRDYSVAGHRDREFGDTVL